MLVMILSGWRIYNASPLFPFRFPQEFTLGGWLAGAIAWHFAAMWLLVGNGLVYLVYSFLSGHSGGISFLSPRGLHGAIFVSHRRAACRMFPAATTPSSA